MLNVKTLISEIIDNDNDSDIAAEIATIVVLDLETTNLPEYNFYKVSITELSMYGFSASELKLTPEDVSTTITTINTITDKINDKASTLPARPRVLHKLNLLFNPQRTVSPTSEKITGLNNYILENETPFNENAAKTIIGFLQHLQQPICLVAHNGWQFDFPIIKQALDKLKLSPPTATVCLDSLRAFMEIDSKRKKEIPVELCPTVASTNNEISNCESDSSFEELTNVRAEIMHKQVEEDFRILNESTPKRPTVSREFSLRKRKLIDDLTPINSSQGFADDKQPETEKRTKSLKARRMLFEGLSCAKTKKFPKAGVYKLGNMYERIFGKPATAAHQAEADVVMLTKLIQYYGIDFLAFAETQAIPYSNVSSFIAK